MAYINNEIYVWGAYMIGERDVNEMENEIETWEAWIDGERDNSVLFTVYAGEDVGEAGASALNVRMSESFNIQKV